LAASDRITPKVVSRAFSTASGIFNWSARAIGLLTVAYAACVAVTWFRYGDAAPTAHSDEADPLLDRVIPDYEISERHHIHIAAPADVTFPIACETDLMHLPLIRAIFQSRALILGRQSKAPEHPRGVLAFTESLGWRVLGELPGREIMMGSATQPWQADVVFRPLTADEFRAFHEPNYVKIIWTLRVDEINQHQSVLRTETRATTTDRAARARFRRYWAFFSPGIWLIRWFLLRQIRAEAETARRATEFPAPS
jgi:hypothetical protein